MHHIQAEMHLRLKALKFSYVADTTLWPKATWGGEGLFDLHIPQSIIEGNQDKYSKLKPKCRKHRERAC